MPFADLNVITVTGTYLDFDGAPYRGWVWFDQPADLGALLDPGGNQIITPSRVRARLDSNGHISVRLPATDDPDITPTGWLYTVTETLIGADGTRPNVYELPVPFDSPGGTFDLSGPVTTTIGDPMLWHVGGPILWHSGQPMAWHS